MPNRVRSTSRGSIRNMIRDLEQSARSERVKVDMDAVVASTTEQMRATMPRRTGALAGSGQWSSEIGSTEYSARITFGGLAAPYAPYICGDHVDGPQPWDEALALREPDIERALGLEFPE
ncbi:MAG: hypothetical protein JWR35_3918 [Marmoricola sp.]|nr:hypothetical protein [Marmoricola sp.]